MAIVPTTQREASESYNAEESTPPVNPHRIRHQNEPVSYTSKKNIEEEIDRYQGSGNDEESPKVMAKDKLPDIDSGHQFTQDLPPSQAISARDTIEYCGDQLDITGAPSNKAIIESPEQEFSHAQGFDTFSKSTLPPTRVENGKQKIGEGTTLYTPTNRFAPLTPGGGAYRVVETPTSEPKLFRLVESLAYLGNTQIKIAWVKNTPGFPGFVHGCLYHGPSKPTEVSTQPPALLVLLMTNQNSRALRYLPQVILVILSVHTLLHPTSVVVKENHLGLSVPRSDFTHSFTNNLAMAEDEPVDPKREFEERCKAPCTRPLKEYQACSKRIQSDEAGQKHCTGQYFDYWNCVDRCVATKLFSHLK
ncbi:unnamed protein product [Fraxinus pennsylvanica]|uniref:Complex III subunit VI n=1 Tax=Fraxinus pennsylvanica TaxID=56036 RepID=A0AAD2EFP6_9LAMI|nr:unnamed protein product [Fraxinus pennsylvanica]